MTELQALIGNPIFIGFVLGLFIGYRTAKLTIGSVKLVDLSKK